MEKALDMVKVLKYQTFVFMKATEKIIKDSALAESLAQMGTIMKGIDKMIKKVGLALCERLQGLGMLESGMGTFLMAKDSRFLIKNSMKETLFQAKGMEKEF